MKYGIWDEHIPVHSLSSYLLHTCYVPCTVHDAENKMTNEWNGYFPAFLEYPPSGKYDPV